MHQKLKDVAFPQAEVLKKALLKRYEQEHAQYLAKKVNNLSAPISFKYNIWTNLQDQISSHLQCDVNTNNNMLKHEALHNGMSVV